MRDDVKGPGFVKFLYNQNPFYLISAAVILYGFRMATEEARFATNPWFLASIFAGYTTLLAITAWFIVRFGKVWDDARSIFMVLLLLFMALSASIDGLFLSDPVTAITFAGVGFAFAVFVTESLVLSLGIRFRTLFRLPLYGMLATSFFFPYLFTLQQAHWPELDSRFIILLFPFVVSATILSLIPSIRRTKKYAAKNGTPWHWPLYPYSIFALAIIGLIGRTIMMGLSFDPTPANGMLGTWLFVPIFLSLTWLLFEIGAAEKNKDLQLLSMVLMPGAMVLAFAWPFFSNVDFYFGIADQIGNPVWLTLLVVVGMYFVAWLDNIEHSGTFLTLALFAAAMLRPDGDLIEDFSSIQSWPCLILAVWSVSSIDRMKRGSCWFLTSCGISIPIANTLTPRLADSFEPLSSLGGHEATVAANLLLVFSCLIVCIHRGMFAKRLKIVLAMMLPVVAVLAAVGSILRPDQAAIAFVYGCSLGVASVLVALLVKSRLHLSSAAISIGASLFAASPLLEFSVGGDNFRLARFMGAGLACFLIGLLVSAIKAGWTRKFTSGIGKLKLEFRAAFPLQEHQEQIVSTEL